MKKIIFLLLILLVLCGCGSTNYTTFKTDADAYVESYGTYEWISPDGVHYWIYSGYERYGMAPRYDSNGELVIGKER